MGNTFFMFVLSIAGLLPPVGSIAQCPGCTPDLTCVSVPAFPTICPAQPPGGIAGLPYEADLSFWMPASFSDPGSGVTVQFQQMTVTGISGLPLGLELETSDPAGVYFPQQNEFGCARICGTPVIAGLYSITINILATVELGGFVTQVPEEFILLLQIAPGSGGNSSFTFSPESGCGSVPVQFNALIEGDPSLTSYTWEFGDGVTSTDPEPMHVFDQPGIHPVTLTTTIGGHVITNVSISGVNGNWCGDVEEPNVPFVGCTGSPDLYFVLTDGNGGTYGSSTQDNTFSASWNGLSLSLDQPPYSITFYDEDGVSQNDQLGTFNIPANGDGTYFINVAGGTTGQLGIAIQPQQVITATDTVVVHPAPVITIGQVGSSICGSDTLIGAIWLLDGDTIEGGAGPCIEPIVPGAYQLIASDTIGCAGISEPFIICPEIEITQTDNVLHVPSGFNSYAWLLNGEPIEGADQPFLIIEGAGNYSVEVDAGDGCVITAGLDLITSVLEMDPAHEGIVVFPNPAKDHVNVIAEGFSGTTSLEIIDPAGRTIHSDRIDPGNGVIHAVVLSGVLPGTYLLSLSDGKLYFTDRIVILN